MKALRATELVHKLAALVETPDLVVVVWPVDPRLHPSIVDFNALSTRIDVWVVPAAEHDPGLFYDFLATGKRFDPLLPELTRIEEDAPVGTLVDLPQDLIGVHSGPRSAS